MSQRKGGLSLFHKAWWTRPLALAALIAAFLGFQSALIFDKSATFDESTILFSGYVYLLTGHDAVNPENPPLAKALFALPLLLSGLELPDEIAHWRVNFDRAPRFSVPQEFLHRDAFHHSFLYYGRAVNALLSTFLALTLFATMRLHMGFRWAFCGMALLLFCPVVMAHSALATVDIGVALFILLSHYCLMRFVSAPSVISWSILAGLAAGCAMLSKMTGVLTLPLIAIQLVLWHLSNPSWRRLSSCVSFLCVATAAALVVVAGAYGFDGMWLTFERLAPRSALCQSLAALPILGAMPLPLPELYLRGFDVVAFFNQPPLGGNVFMGRYYPIGGSWWYYYLFTLGVKLPLPLLILMGVGAAYCAARLRNKPLLYLYLAIPTLILLNFSLLSYRQLGARYVMPALPFLVILAVLGLRWIWKKPGFPMRLAAAALLSFYFYDSLRVVPHSLAYCNQLIGGPEGGRRWLADSDLDWGQDLPALREWLDSNGDPPVYLFYYGTAPPAFHGVQSSLDASLIAVSVSTMYEVSSQPAMSRLAACVPVDSVGHSIYLYETPPWLRKIFEDTKRYNARKAVRTDSSMQPSQSKP